MNKGTFLIVLVLAIVLYNVSAAPIPDIVCRSAEPGKIAVSAYNIEEGIFSIMLQNLLGKDIDLLDFDSGQFVIETEINARVRALEKFDISGTYPTDLATFDEEIIIRYADSGGSENEVVIECQKKQGNAEWIPPVLELSLMLLVIGLVGVLYGYFKKRKILLLSGIGLIVLAIILLWFLGSSFYLY